METLEERRIRRRLEMSFRDRVFVAIKREIILAEILSIPPMIISVSSILSPKDMVDNGFTFINPPLKD